MSDIRLLAVVVGLGFIWMGRAGAAELEDGTYSCTASYSVGIQPSQKEKGGRFAGRVRFSEEKNKFSVTVEKRTPPASCRFISPFTKWTSCEAVRRLRFSKNKYPARLYADADDISFRNISTYFRLDPKAMRYVFNFQRSSSGEAIDSYYIEEGECTKG